jgi:hypothetical protein
MSVNLPGEVVTFLNLIGVMWPDVDEDQVRLFADHVRDFVGNLNNSHAAASSTIEQVGAYYTSSSYSQLVGTWARMSQEHMTSLGQAASAVATALDGAAYAIEAAKIAAIAELAVLAATFVADQAAAVATLGVAEAAEVAVIAAARKCVNLLEQMLVQHILAEVIQLAIVPLEQIVEKALSGLVFRGLAGALGVPAAGAAVGSGFSIAPDAVREYADRLDSHAQEIAGHAVSFGNAIAGVSFGG